MLGIKMWRDLNSIFIGKKLPKYAKKWREWQCGLGRAENNICGNQESRRLDKGLPIRKAQWSGPGVNKKGGNVATI